MCDLIPLSSVFGGEYLTVKLKNVGKHVKPKIVVGVDQLRP